MRVNDITSWLQRMLGNGCLVIDGASENGWDDVEFDHRLILDMSSIMDVDMIKTLVENNEQEWAVITTTCELGNEIFSELYDNTAFLLIGDDYSVFIYTDSEDTEDKIYKYFPAGWHILIPGRAG